MDIDIIFGFNATGKTLSYNNLNEEEYVKVSTQDILNNNSFGYKTDEYNHLVNKFEKMINENIEKNAISEFLDIAETEHYKDEFKMKYSKILKYNILSNIEKPKSPWEKTRLTMTGLVNLNKEFQNVLKDKKFSQIEVLRAFGVAVSEKINTWNKKWENARSIAKLGKYELIGKNINADESLVKFFKGYSQSGLQKLNPLTLIDIKINTTNWENLINYSIYEMVVNEEVSKLMEKIKILEKQIKRKNLSFFNEAVSLLEKTDFFDKLVINEEMMNIAIEKLSNGQKSSVKMIEKIAQSDIENKNIAMDDTFESTDTFITENIFKTILNSGNKKVRIYTHRIIDLSIGNSKINHYWMSSDGNEYPGSSIMYNYTCIDPKDNSDLSNIINITYRILNRRIGQLSSLYNSNKKYVSYNHGVFLWNFISELKIVNRKKEIAKYFASSRKFINKITPKDNKDFKKLCISISKVLDHYDDSLKYNGISVKFLKDFWLAVGNKELRNKFMHMLDPIMRVGKVEELL